MVHRGKSVNSRYRRTRTLLAALALGALAACAPPPAATGDGPAKKASAMPSDCAAMKRRQEAMVANGQENSQAYRSLLDTYLRRCFNR